jgi:hypothetical protein
MPAVIDCNAFTGSLTGVATFTAVAPVSGDTLQVRNFNPGTRAFLVEAGNKHATAGILRVRSPYLLDDVNAIRARTLAADPTNLLPDEVQQPLHAQDQLIVESTGGASAETVAGVLVNWYEAVGVQGRCISYDEANSRVSGIMVNEVAVTGLAAPNWGSTLLSAGTGVLKANQDYAILGYILDVPCTAIGILGLDTGSFRVGATGSTDRFRTREHFMLMARRTQLDYVPVINAANAPGTQVQVIDSAGATAVNVGLVMGLLT